MNYEELAWANELSPAEAKALGLSIEELEAMYHSENH